MQRIIDFILRYKNYISVTALIIISLSLISLDYSAKIGGFRALVVSTVGWMQSVFSWVPNPFAVKQENQALRELNLQLSAEVTRMRNALVENERLRELIGFTKDLKSPHIVAEVVGSTNVEMRHYITINKGSAAGISEGMAVRNDAGLIGLVISLSSNYAMVELITNRNVHIAAKNQRNAHTGILMWEGADHFIMKNVPKSFNMLEGDIILTSNASSRYPEDIPIGRITSATEEPGDLFQKITVEPLVNFSTLEQVFVLTELPDPEKVALIKDFEAKQLQKKKK
jgi:rod shape-determining protein MreC